MSRRSWGMPASHSRTRLIGPTQRDCVALLVGLYSFKQPVEIGDVRPGGRFGIARPGPQLNTGEEVLQHSWTWTRMPNNSTDRGIAEVWTGCLNEYKPTSMDTVALRWSN